MKKFNEKQFFGETLLELKRMGKEEIIDLLKDMKVLNIEKNIIDIIFLFVMPTFNNSNIKNYKRDIIEICNQLMNKEDYDIGDVHFLVNVVEELNSKEINNEDLSRNIIVYDKFNCNQIILYKEIKGREVISKSFIEVIKMYDLNLLDNIEFEFMKYIIREGKNNNPRFWDNGLVIIELDTITYNLFGYVDELTKRKIKDIIERLTLLQIMISTKNSSFLSKTPIYSVEFVPKEDIFVIVIGRDERTKYNLYNNQSI
ncbi:MAG: hypothetical protein RSF67_05960 [Clostridia bacterium]